MTKKLEKANEILKQTLLCLFLFSKRRYLLHIVMRNQSIYWNDHHPDFDPLLELVSQPYPDGANQIPSII